MSKGDSIESYIKMPSYMYTVGTMYPKFYMHKLTENEFMYLFIASYPFTNDCELCMSIIILNGVYLKRVYKYTFFFASTLYGVALQQK